MSEVKIYSVSNEYIDYLRSDPKLRNVFLNKPEVHIRKYLGVVLRHDDFNYFVPFSSPKETDYTTVDGKKTIRKSIIPVIRMTSRDCSGELELKGTLKLNNMIPVPESELTIYDLDGEQDSNYKILLEKEWEFIRSNTKLIFKNAKVLYNQKTKAATFYPDGNVPRYLTATIDFKYAEQKCRAFCKK